RDDDGQPIVTDDGIVTVEQYRAVLHAITHKAHHSARSRNSKRTTSPLLALLATCRDCERVMHRCRNVGKPSLTCSHCNQMVTTAPLADYLVRRLLNERGSQRMYRRTLEVPND